eukprot:3940588-Rhodomonas_salina.1
MSGTELAYGGIGGARIELAYDAMRVHSTIPYLSTAHPIAPYASSVPHTAQPQTLSQYGSSTTIRYLSTARLPPYAIAVPRGGL